MLGKVLWKNNVIKINFHKSTFKMILNTKVLLLKSGISKFVLRNSYIYIHCKITKTMNIVFIQESSKELQWIHVVCHLQWVILLRPYCFENTYRSHPDHLDINLHGHGSMIWFNLNYNWFLKQTEEYFYIKVAKCSWPDNSCTHTCILMVYSSILLEKVISKY